MSSRLSHCESTFGWILLGRCVESKSHRPYLRPSAAICASRAVTAAWSGSEGSEEHRLCASSITRSTGARRSRSAQMFWSSASAAIERSRGSSKPARSSTSAREPSLDSARQDADSVRDHTDISRRPRFSNRWASARSIGRSPVARRRANSWSSAPPSDVEKSPRSALNSSRSARGSTPSTAARSAGESSGNATVRGRAPGSRAARPDRSTRTLARRRRSAVWSDSSGSTSPRCTKSAFGSKMIMLRAVWARRRSRTTPSAYVFPEPLCPQTKVWRLKPPVRTRAGTTSEPARTVPTSRSLRDQASYASSTSRGARVIRPPAKGRGVVSRTVPSATSARIRPVQATAPRTRATSSTWPRRRRPPVHSTSARSPAR